MLQVNRDYADDIPAMQQHINRSQMSVKSALLFDFLFIMKRTNVHTLYRTENLSFILSITCANQLYMRLLKLVYPKQLLCSVKLVNVTVNRHHDDIVPVIYRYNVICDVSYHDLLLSDLLLQSINN